LDISMINAKNGELVLVLKPLTQPPPDSSDVPRVSGFAAIPDKALLVGNY
jgi:hypothetical protein